MFTRNLLACLCAGTLVSISFSTLSKEQTQLGFYAGYTKGGEEIDVPFNDGSIKQIDFGGLGAFGTSVRTQFNNTLISKINAGYHFDYVNAENGQVFLGRYTADALVGLKANKDITLYAGATYHLSPKVIIEHDDRPTGTIMYKPTLGYVFEIALTVEDQAELSFRYVKMDYDFSAYKVNGTGEVEVNASGAESVDANHFGIYLTRFL